MITDNRNKNIIPFSYQIALSLGGNASGQTTLTLAADSVFEWHQLLGMGSVDNATDYAPNSFSLQISDQSTGRQLQSGKVPQRIICANGYHDTMMRRAVQFPPSANLLFDFTNLSGSTNVVTLNLVGFKVFQA